MTAFDIGGKMMPAIDVFSLSIKALVNDFMDRRKRYGLDFIDFSDIKWVLTVPAIWSERARNFMRNCAIKVGYTVIYYSCINCNVVVIFFLRNVLSDRERKTT